MRILFVGETWLGSSARSLQEALQQCPGVLLASVAEDGHAFDGRSLSARVANRLLGPLQQRRLHLAVLRGAEAFRPDVVLVYKGGKVGVATLAALRKEGYPTCNVFPDCSPHLHGTRLKRAMGCYDLVISTKPFHPRLWATLYGYPNPCVCVPHGYDPLVHCWPEPPGPAEVDVALCASWRQEYHQLMHAFGQLLPDPGISVTLAGPGWEARRAEFPAHWQYAGPVMGRAYGEFLRTARIVLAPVNREVVIRGQRQPGDEDTTRTYELAAAHCFFLHQRTGFVQTVYEEHTEVPLWRDVEEMARLVREWLPKEQERRDMADRAHARAVPAYSIPARAREILNHLEALVASFAGKERLHGG